MIKKKKSPALYINIFFMFVFAAVNFAFSPSLKDSYRDPKYFLFVTAGFVFLSAIFVFKSEQKIKLSKKEILPIIFSLWMLISLIPAFNKTEGLKMLLFWNSGIFFMLFVINNPGADFLKAKFPAAISAVSLVVCFYAFMQYIGFDIYKTEYAKMPVSFFGNLNYAAHYIVAVIPLLLLVQGKPSAEFFYRITGLFSIIYLFLTQSRGGFVSIIAALIFLSLLFIIKNKQSLVKIKTLLNSELKTKLIIIFVSSIIILFTLNFLDHWITYNHFLTAFDSASETNKFRILSYSASLKLACDKPILGTGTGNFRFFINQYNPPELWKIQDAFSKAKLLQAHNDYLQILTETGFPGLLIFLIFVGFVLVSGIKKYFYENKLESRFTLGILSGFFGILIHSIFDFPLFNASSAMCFWIFAGFLLYSPVPLCKQDKKQKNVSKKEFYIFAVIIAVTGAVWIFKFGINELQSSKYFKKALISFGNKNYPQSAEQASAALSFNKANIELWGMLGDSYKNQGYFEKAVEAYSEASKKDPSYIPYYERAAYCYLKSGNIEKAKQYYLKVIDINAFSVPNLLNIAKLNYSEKKYKEAAEFFERAYKINPDFDVEIIPLLAESFYQLKDYEDAKKYYLIYYGKKPDNISVLERLNEISLALNHPDKQKYGILLRILNAENEAKKIKIQ